MVTNKKIALALFIINLVYTGLGVFLFFYLHNQFFIDFTKKPPARLPSESDLVIIPFVLNLAIYWGIYWVLNIFNEKLWIRLGVMIFILLKTMGLAVGYSFSKETVLSHTYILNLLSLGYFAVTIYMLVALLLVKEIAIRKYLRWFVALIIISFLLPQLGDYLYDDFNIRYLLINQDVLLQLCFIVTLILFAEVYRLAVHGILPEKEG